MDAAGGRNHCSLFSGRGQPGTGTGRPSTHRRRCTVASPVGLAPFLNHFLGLFHAMDTTKTYRSARHLFPWGTGQPSSPKDNEPQRSRAVRGQGAAAQTMSRQLEQNDQATTKSFTKDTRKKKIAARQYKVLALNKISAQSRSRKKNSSILVHFMLNFFLVYPSQPK